MDEQRAFDQGLKEENTLITDLTTCARLSHNKALRLIKLSKSTAYYRNKPRPCPAPKPVLQAVPAPTAPGVELAAPGVEPTPEPWQGKEPAVSSVRQALAEHERQFIVDAITAYPQLSVSGVFNMLFNKGIYRASLRTWWRVAKQHKLLHKDRVSALSPGKRSPTPRVKPRLEATQPGQVVCWDVTFLPSLVRGKTYALHLAIDLFSRKIVGAKVAPTENTSTAVELLTQVLADNPGVVTVHSDNGSAMTSTRVRRLLADHGVALSLIRPRVSDDNAFVESVFHTLKYRPFYPKVFASMDQARVWVEEFVVYYNTVHPHSGVAGHTPQSVFDGSWRAAHRLRVQALDAHYRQFPQRYVGQPVVQEVAGVVRLNGARDDGSVQERVGGVASLLSA